MRRHRSHQYALISDINVVSLIDVMLLLLVIFMITAPMMTNSLDLVLPRIGSATPVKKKPIAVSIDRSGAIGLNSRFYDLTAFRAAFLDLTKRGSEDGVLIQADTGVSYGTVAQVLDAVRVAGIADVGLAVQTNR